MKQRELRELGFCRRCLNGAFGVPAVYSAEDGEWYVGEIGGEKLYSVIG